MKKRKKVVKSMNKFVRISSNDVIFQLNKQDFLTRSYIKQQISVVFLKKLLKVLPNLRLVQEFKFLNLLFIFRFMFLFKLRLVKSSDFKSLIYLYNNFYGHSIIKKVSKHFLGFYLSKNFLKGSFISVFFNNFFDVPYESYKNLFVGKSYIDVDKQGMVSSSYLNTRGFSFCLKMLDRFYCDDSLIQFKERSSNLIVLKSFSALLSFCLINFVYFLFLFFFQWFQLLKINISLLLMKLKKKNDG